MIERVITEDGSATFFNEKYQQCYHSKFGAYREAYEKYTIACKIEELAAKQDQIKILDVCFGLGYNSGVAIEKALEINPNIQIEVIALENDINILKEIKNLEVPASYSEINAELAKIADEQQIKADNFQIKLLLGDARETIRQVDTEFDAIFFDPFSPKECPELWTAEFIGDAVKLAKPGAYIATYSSARVVKENFTKAGCQITEGPKAGRRTGGVLALKL